MQENNLSIPSLPNNIENQPTMSWNDVALKYLLKVVYQL